MFKKIKQTKTPPQVPTLVWDGKCGFCKFWKTRWELKTGGEINFKTYQEVSRQFPDIPLKEFKKASRFIETDGNLYSGPDSAYRTMVYADNSFWHSLYHRQKWFMRLSDTGYNHIAKNRSFYFKVTKFLFGKTPHHLKPYWLIYTLILLGVFVSFFI